MAEASAWLHLDALLVGEVATDVVAAVAGLAKVAQAVLRHLLREPHPEETGTRDDKQ